jgi:hypothetical protein
VPLLLLDQPLCVRELNSARARRKRRGHEKKELSCRRRRVDSIGQASKVDFAVFEHIRELYKWTFGRIKAEVSRRWPMTSLLDVLKKTDLRVGFFERFKSVASRESLPSDILRRRFTHCHVWPRNQYWPETSCCHDSR